MLPAKYFNLKKICTIDKSSGNCVELKAILFMPDLDPKFLFPNPTRT
jgi:hypothetical protein